MALDIDALQLLVERFQESKVLSSLKSLLAQDIKGVAVDGLQGSATALFLNALANDMGQHTILAIARDEEQAAYLHNDLAKLSGEEKVFYYPSLYKKAIRYGHIDLANEVVRNELIECLRDGTIPCLIVTYPEALLEGVVDRDTYEDGRLELHIGSEVDRSKLREKLWSMGFEERDYVYYPGDFAVRGSIIDIYSFASEYPVRLDFFDRELESIRRFEPESQLSYETVSDVVILSSFASKGEKLCSLLSLLPNELLVYIDQAKYFSDSIQTTYSTAPIHPEDNSFGSLADLQKALIEPEKLKKEINNYKIIASNPPSGMTDKSLSFGQQPEPIFHKNFDLLHDQLVKYHSDGYITAIMSDQKGQFERLQSIFNDQGTGANFTPIMPTLHAGFIDDHLKITLFTDHSIFERYHNFKLKSDKIRKSRAVMTLKDIQSFECGDYVVHQNYGIATFGGLFTINQNGKQKETVRLNFKGGDSVYVSIHALHHISKYKSKDAEEVPQLGKLGSSAWDNLKERTKKKVKEIAQNLIKLYAERLKVKGFAFSQDSYLQKELEASFMYEDTPDQEQATKDVKADMESNTPMDRLICGDVGFGKTEVAIRAAFKAVADNKQVAVLVPTTILAYQHYNTFISRLKNFPVSVDYLSQARTASERKEVLNKLKAGKLDIIIGTHTITGKKVEFHDLGLLIIDEEQKFGVAVKERLREMRSHVDTLTMTATPIPRTLQFSLMGARDLSNISTPPPNRYPIRTEHLLYDIDVLAEAINAELARDGQVFFVHNRVQNINDVARDIQNAVPGIRIGIGHGQMPAKELEKVLLDFITHKYDLLLATTIIENGIDVPNANTIIINDAHRFGLSDLHQLRGRVGRGNRRAYCLLLTPPLDCLTTNAKRRMQSITSFSELGSGIHIAMQDLYIRGAGNLLGAEQSGFIADLGFETYKRILEEAVLELKDSDLYEELQPLGSSEPLGREYVYETVVETDAEAYFPQTYVPGDSERINLYRELESLKTNRDIESYRRHIIDRFGELPKEASELLKVVELRILAKQLGIERITLKQDLLKLYFVSNPASRFYKSELFTRILDKITRFGKGLSLKEEHGRLFIVARNIESVGDAFQLLESLSR